MSLFSSTRHPIQFRIELDRSYGGNARGSREERAARRAARKEKETELGNLIRMTYLQREDAEAAFEKACLSPDFYVQEFMNL